MKTGTDPIGDLVLLCRAAADAGEPWRGRLGAEWIPRLLAERSSAEVAAALREWLPDDSAGEHASTVERAVVEAMAEDGYS